MTVIASPPQAPVIASAAKRREAIPQRVFPRNAILPRVALAVFFFLNLSGSAAAQADHPTGDTIVLASIGEPSNLIPPLASDSASQAIVGYIFNGLLKYNPDLELEGDLAERWEILNEGKSIVFHLRKGVFWHDGSPFTADDVEFTYQKMVDPQVPTPYSGDFLKVTKFEVPDPHTVIVHYDEPFSPALASWTLKIMAKHLMENEDFLKSRYARHPVGTGPYRFQRWITADRVELTVFEDYFEGRPRIDRIIYRVIPDPATTFLELHQETVDMMNLTPLQYRRQTDDPFFQDTFRKYRYASLSYTYLGYNLKNPLFGDRRVRRALNLAVDKKEIIDGVSLGLGRISTGPFTPESWAYNPQVKPAAFDPDRAVELLAEAGWQDTDGDGVLDQEGEKFEFTITTNQGNLLRQQTAEIIQRRLAEIGITVKIKIVEWSAFIKEFIDKRKFEAVLLGWGLALEPDPHDIWHSSKDRKGEFNFISYKNERVDELIEAGRRSFDREERRRAYHEIHRILQEDQPTMFLYILDRLPIIHRRFRNVEATALGLGYNFIDWYVLPEEQKYTRFKI